MRTVSIIFFKMQSVISNHREIINEKVLISDLCWISLLSVRLQIYPAGIYLFKINNENTRTMCEICSKLTIKTPERRQWPLSQSTFGQSRHLLPFTSETFMKTLWCLQWYIRKYVHNFIWIRSKVANVNRNINVFLFKYFSFANAHPPKKDVLNIFVR